MKQPRTLGQIVLLMVAAGLIAGCGWTGWTGIKLGFQESERQGHWDLHYGTFTAREVNTFSADAGDTLVLDYKVNVDKGELALSVENPDGAAIFDLVLAEDARDVVRLQIEQSGRYTIVVAGKDTGGSTELDWDVE
jgi:hypothetical protein